MHSSGAWSQHADDYSRYASRWSSFAQILVRVVCEILAREKRKLRVLDVACGHGIASELFLHEAGVFSIDAQLDASDFAPRMLELARELLGTGSSVGQCFLGDATKMPEAAMGQYDAVFSSFGIMILDEPLLAIREMLKVLRPGGLLATTSWSRRPGNDPWGLDLVTRLRFLAEHEDAEFVDELPEPGPGFLEDASNAGELKALVESAGFQDVVVLSTTCSAVLPSAREQIEGCVTNPIIGGLLGQHLNLEDPEKRERLVQRALNTMARLEDNRPPPYISVRQAFIMTARAPPRPLLPPVPSGP